LATSSQPEPDYYEILGVARTATADEIETAYRLVARAAHPDAGGNDGLFRLVELARNTLRDPSSRAAYDSRQRHGRNPSPPDRPASPETSHAEATPPLPSIPAPAGMTKLADLAFSSPLPLAEAQSSIEECLLPLGRSGKLAALSLGRVSVKVEQSNTTGGWLQGRAWRGEGRYVFQVLFAAAAPSETVAHLRIWARPTTSSHPGDLEKVATALVQTIVATGRWQVSASWLDKTIRGWGIADLFGNMGR
jgi:hypothetical protein